MRSTHPAGRGIGSRDAMPEPGGLRDRLRRGRLVSMTALAEETARLVDSLPPSKAQALVEFARYLADKADEEDWDRQLGDPRYASKLAAASVDAKRDADSGAATPLDPERL